MMPIHRWVLLGAAMTVTACGGPRVQAVSPEQIAGLEAQVAERGGDAVLLRSLGEAYYNAQRYEDARSTLERAIARDSTNQSAGLYLAFSLDELGAFADARAAYQRVLARKPDRATSSAINERLLLLARKEALSAAKAALAREGTLASQPAGENTIAVLPLRYTGTNPELKPLERGLAQLMVTDLGTVERLVLVERVNVQAILDELQLGDSGRMDEATAARSGRLVRASRVIQGTISDAEPGQISIEAALVDATTSAVSGTASGKDRMEALFDIEKQVVFGVIDQLGIQLTPAERQKIAERPTSNIQAFLAYSRGLAAQDRGSYNDAAGAFRQAVSFDPNFQAAKQAAQVSNQLSHAATVHAGDLAPNLVGVGGDEGSGQRLRNAVARVTPTGGDAVTRGAGNDGGSNTNERKAVQEGTDTQGATDATRNTTVTITVTRPGAP